MRRLATIFRGTKVRHVAPRLIPEHRAPSPAGATLLKGAGVCAMSSDPLFDWADSSLPEDNVTAPDYWKLWKIVDPISIREAARLLAGLNPRPSSNRMDADREKAAKADAYDVALIRAVQSGRLHAVSALAWEADGYEHWPVACNPDSGELCNETKISVAKLAQWAHGCELRHYWPVDSNQPEQGTLDLAAYPVELRAAIEAFDAVRHDTKATGGKSAKQALAAWLEANKPELTANARDRIAIVANWQPVGGAPKTPSE